jgi:uncharacterized protein (TIGR03067 family)
MKQLLILCAVVVGGAEPAKVTPEEEAKKLEGTWKEVSREYQGEAVAKKFIEKSKLIFSADGKLTMIDGFKVERTYVIDPSKDPKTIDIIDTITKVGPDGKKVTTELKNVGIYELDGDKLTICYVRSDGPKAGQRPTELKTKAKSGSFLSVYERVKP